MSHSDVLPELNRCPNCKTTLKQILYGMLPGNPGPDFVVGGCMVDGSEPHKQCPSCGWEGGYGGRTYDTEWLNEWETEEPEGSGNFISKSRVLDIRHFDDDAVEAIACDNLIGRFELVFRGRSPEDVDAMYEDELSMPLIAKSAMFAFYNSSTSKVELIGSFYAFRTSHIFTFIRPNSTEWEAVATVKAFHDVVLANKGDEIQVWNLQISGEMTDEEFVNNNARYGSAVVAACFDGKAISEEELALEGTKFERRIFWPEWYLKEFNY